MKFTLNSSTSKWGDHAVVTPMHILRFIISFAVVVTVSVFTLNFINTKLTHCTSIENSYLAKSYDSNKLNKIDLDYNPQDSMLFSLATKELEERTLLFCTYGFSYHIYCNNQVVAQNVDPQQPKFNAANNFLFLDETDLPTNSNIEVLDFSIRMVKDKLSSPPIVYIASNEEILDTRLLLIVNHVLNLIIFMLFVVVCIAIFVLYRYRVAIGCLIVNLLFLVKVFEIGILSDFLNFYNPVHDFSIRVIEVITFLINTYLLYYVFKVNMKVYWYFAPIIAVSILVYSVSESTIAVGVAAVLMRFFTRIYPVFKGYIEQSLGIYLAYAMMIYEGFSQYHVFTKKGFLDDGILVSIFEVSEIGYILYCLVIIYAFVKYSMNKTKELEQKKQEYETITLIKDIGTELKMPLNMIKEYSEQMSQYVDLPKEEQKRILEKSLKSVKEIENLTRNIDEILNVDNIKKD